MISASMRAWLRSRVVFVALLVSSISLAACVQLSSQTKIDAFGKAAGDASTIFTDTVNRVVESASDRPAI